MALKLTKNKAELSGIATVDEAEDLMRWLQKAPAGTVSLAKASHAHTAVIQALAAVPRTVATDFSDAFLAECLRQLTNPKLGNMQ